MITKPFEVGQRAWCVRNQVKCVIATIFESSVAPSGWLVDGTAVGGPMNNGTTGLMDSANFWPMLE